MMTHEKGQDWRRKILSAKEVKVATRMIKEMLGEAIVNSGIKYNMDMEDSIRFMTVGTHCQDAREAISQSIKDVSKILKIPQYRIREIENGGISRIQPNILNKYIAFLRLEEWYSQWKFANKAMVNKYDLI
jgi:phage-related tail protein